MKNYEIFNIKEATPLQGLSEARRGREFFGVFFLFHSIHLWHS
jgi:hypothetical protein